MNRKLSTLLDADQDDAVRQVWSYDIFYGCDLCQDDVCLYHRTRFVRPAVLLSAAPEDFRAGLGIWVLSNSCASTETYRNCTSYMHSGLLNGWIFFYITGLAAKRVNNTPGRRFDGCHRG